MGLLSATRPGLQKVSGPYVPGSIGNACSYSDPTLNQLVNEVGQLGPNSPRYTALWNQIQEFVIKNALSIYVDFIPSVAAASKHVRNFHVLPYLGPVVDYWDVSVKG